MAQYTEELRRGLEARLGLHPCCATFQWGDAGKEFNLVLTFSFLMWKTDVVILPLQGSYDP